MYSPDTRTSFGGGHGALNEAHTAAHEADTLGFWGEPQSG